METHKEEWEKQDRMKKVHNIGACKCCDNFMHLFTHQKQSIMDMCDEMKKREPRVYSLPYNEALSDLKERISKL